ncbi:MAG: peptidylprolyl isomerase [Micrococcales bacterium]
MATNREIKAQAEARRRSYEAKLAEVGQKAQRRKNDNRFALVIAGLAVLLAVGASAGHQAYVGAQPTPTATPSVTNSPSTTPSASPTASNSKPVPDKALAQGRTWTGTMTIDGKPLAISLDGAKAPQAVANFISLAESGFYNNVKCHRLTTSGLFVLQCGDPTGTGSGGPGYSFGPIENAPANNFYPTGTLAMARRGNDANSMGSQFFIVYRDTTLGQDSAGGYTVFGKVTSGMSVIDNIASQGVQGGNADGTPVAKATLGAISLK